MTHLAESTTSVHFHRIAGVFTATVEEVRRVEHSLFETLRKMSRPSVEDSDGKHEMNFEERAHSVGLEAVAQALEDTTTH